MSAARRLPRVCVQGLGFVGAAMAVAVASAKKEDGSPCFEVIGVDVPTAAGKSIVDSLNAGIFPFKTTDTYLLAALERCHESGNFRCATDPKAYETADVVVVDVPFEIEADPENPRMVLEPFREAVRQVAERIPPGALVVIESTVAPGTCEKIIYPEIEEAFRKRSLPSEKILLAHSYERVMPGRDYFNSIVNFWRVYAGHTPEAADACERFLSQVVRVKEFPLTRLPSTRASETAKALENSYRAVNIALVEEWGRFAESVGLDLFEIISTIRQRPTHANLRQPGFGVGGYCLTKDPLLAKAAAADFFGIEASFPFCTQAVKINREMPLVSLAKAKALLGELRGKQILLLGASYKSDVADTRSSPSTFFIRNALAQGARVTCHDPLVSVLPELGISVENQMPASKGWDLVIFAVPHAEYARLDVRSWLGGETPAVLDANHVLRPEQLRAFRDAGCTVAAIGRGDL